MSNKIYFKNFDDAGDLYIKSVYIFFEEPILFLCVDRYAKFYLCLCSEVRREYIWILAQTDFNTLRNMIQNNTSIYETFRQSNNKYYIVRWKNGMNKDDVSCVNFSDISPLDLPEQDVYLDASDENKKIFIGDLEEILQESYEYESFDEICDSISVCEGKIELKKSVDKDYGIKQYEIVSEIFTTEVPSVSYEKIQWSTYDDRLLIA